MDPPIEVSFHFFAFSKSLVLNYLNSLGCLVWMGLVFCCYCYCFEDFCLFVSRLVAYPQHMSLGNFSASLLISDLIFILQECAFSTKIVFI